MARKSAFVNEMILQSLQQDQQTVSPIVKVVTKLDDEIATILNDKKLDEYEKAKIYSQALQRYLSTRDNLESKTTPPKTDVPLLPTTTNYSDSSILDTIPKKFTKQAKNLLRHISSNSKLKWGEDGVVSFEGLPIEGSNIVDLLNDTVRNRKTFQPHGWQKFSNALHEINVPSELIGNPYRRITVSPSPSPPPPPLPSSSSSSTFPTRTLPRRSKNYSRIFSKKGKPTRWQRYM